MNNGLFRRSPFPGAQQRVGNAERGAVLELLSRALGEGYLELGEYDNRITAVHGARTVGDLMGQVADLPPAFRWPPAAPATVAPMPGPVGPGAGPHPVPAGLAAVPYSVPGGAFAPQPAPVSGAAHGMAIASAVLGSISLVSAFCSGIGAIPGVAAVLLAVRPLRAGDNTARVGMVLGLVGVVLSIAVFALSFVLSAASGSAL